MATREEAERAVRDIAEAKGCIDDETWEQLRAALEPKKYAQVQRAMSELRKLAGNAVQKIAHEIYASGARFVFELLQNADDNSYTRARSSGACPFITFNVHEDRIVMECNEDGFTAQNLSAICDVGKSTKTQSRGYIGNKGIGFKSVFMAAWKVHIQSGHFSFRCEHRRGDSGLGMVTPIWTDMSTDGEGSSLTRITLFLHTDGGSVQTKYLHITIRDQFESFEPACLLFLRNLKKITVNFFEQDDWSGTPARSNTFELTENGHDIARLETTTRTQNSTARVDCRRYRKFIREVDGLPLREDHRSAGTEAHLNTDSSAEIVLAFPLTSDGLPFVEAQHLFAFLPMRSSNYGFIIHSDFDTSANRQDVMTTSRRNQQLLRHIASTFVDAIKSFCNDGSTMQHEWPAFLPLVGQTHDAFWRTMDDEIGRLVSESPLLLSRNRQELRTVEEVVQLATVFLDEDLSPLLDDPIEDPFLLSAYPFSATQRLKGYGLKVMSFDLVVDLIRADLNSPGSKIKSVSTPRTWHSKFAQLLTSTTGARIIDRLKAMYFVPLWNGDWARIKDGPVYFPTTDGVAIPAGLSLRIIHPDATANDDRKALFTTLGAKEPAVADVRTAIMRVYNTSVHVTKEASLAHLTYLYRTRQSSTPGMRSISDVFMELYVITTRGCRVFPSRSDIYLSSGGRYGPDELLPPDFVHVLDAIYLEDAPITTGSLSWTSWLCKHLKVHERLRFVDRSGKSLSRIWDYVSEHQPKKLLPMLQHLWKDEKDAFIASDNLRKQVMETSARKLCRHGTMPTCQLQGAFLPLPALLEIYHRFASDELPFPFLDVEYADNSRWEFLCTYFNVRKTHDLTFLLSILVWIKQGKSATLEADWRCKVQKLYVAIRAQCVSDGDGTATRSRIKDFIDKGQLVHIPNSRRTSSPWSAPSDCLWTAPRGMVTKHSLSIDTITADVSAQDLEIFYTRILEIKRATIEDFLHELCHLSAHGVDKPDHITDIYRELRKLARAPYLHQLRTEFESRRLIYVAGGQHRWYKASECLWSSSTNISGRVTLNGDYDGLKDFFVDSVGVNLLTLQMVYKELVHSSGGKTVDEIKNTIRSLNALLVTERETLDPKPLLQAPIFPVKYGNGSFATVSGSTEFVVPDRDNLACHFSDKVTMLDYSLEEVHRLKPFLEWTRLDSRYLSISVKEITSVADGVARLIRSPNRDIKRKAYALLRIAATFNSPRWQANPDILYHTLRGIEVVESDCISSMLTLHQDGKQFNVNLEAGDMHIDETQNGLKIFVPRRKRAQDICFGSSLPRRLATWIMQRQGTNIQEHVPNNLIIVLTSCLGNSRTVVESLLERQGIIQVPTACEDDPDDDENADDDSYLEENASHETRQDDGDAAEGPRETSSMFPGNDLYNATPSRSLNVTSNTISSPETSLSRLRTPDKRRSLSHDEATPAVPPSIQRPTVRGTSASPRFTFGANDEHAGVSAQTLSSFWSAPQPMRSVSPFTFQSLQFDDISQYRAMVERVVARARSASFPSTGVFNMTALANALAPNGSIEQYDGIENMRGFRSSSQLERDKKVGAAGELYVYELLSNLHPPLQGWSLDNWQSRIRHYISCHPDYNVLQPWVARETADLVYADDNGDFTRLLHEKGHLDHLSEQQRRRIGTKYFIEVKTTTGHCDTPFFMSKNQFRLMQHIHSKSHGAEAYIIIRIFNVNSGNIGMKVYVDPERLRVSGELLFTSEKYSVAPGPGVDADYADDHDCPC